MAQHLCETYKFYSENLGPYCWCGPLRCCRYPPDSKGVFSFIANPHFIVCGEWMEMLYE